MRTHQKPRYLAGANDQKSVGIGRRRELRILANRLGIGTRHLSRLFQKHLSASPIHVAKTTRVQRAKRLLDETDLSIAEIAMRGGLGSLRRTNAVFAEVYRRPPTEIRNVRVR